MRHAAECSSHHLAVIVLNSIDILWTRSIAPAEALIIQHYHKPSASPPTPGGTFYRIQMYLIDFFYITKRIGERGLFKTKESLLNAGMTLSLFESDWNMQDPLAAPGVQT